MTHEDRVFLAAMILAAVDLVRGMPADSLDEDGIKARAEAIVKNFEKEKA